MVKYFTLANSLSPKKELPFGLILAIIFFLKFDNEGAFFRSFSSKFHALMVEGKKDEPKKGLFVPGS